MDFDLLYKRLIPRLKLTAQKYRNYVSSLNEDDLYQEACFYLWDKYKNGVPAGINDTYIVIGCEFHIRNEIRKQRRRATFVSLDDPIEGTEFTLKDTIADPRDNFNQINRSVTINDILNNGFTKREKEVFAQLIDGYTVREIGVRLGISHVRVVKLKRNIIKRWQRKVKTSEIKQMVYCLGSSNASSEVGTPTPHQQDVGKGVGEKRLPRQIDSYLSN